MTLKSRWRAFTAAPPPREGSSMPLSDDIKWHWHRNWGAYLCLIVAMLIGASVLWNSRWLATAALLLLCFALWVDTR
jgi:hypothetical protein